QKSEEAVHAKERPMTIQHKLLLRRSQLPPRRVQRNAMLHGCFPQLRLVRAILGPRPGINRAVVQSLLLIRDDQVDIEINGVAKALATLARAVRIVEREQPRFRFTVNAMAKLAFVGLGKAQTPWLGFFIPGNRLVNDLS